MSGRLVLCATPIGNLEDITLRALDVLRRADVIACEDTRRTRKLLTHHGIPAPRLVVYNDVNERRQAPALVGEVREGRTVALVSDAGTPGLSDPGFTLVRACLEAGLDVAVAPGANAAITALVMSGLPADRFSFEGFLPRKRAERARRIEELAGDPRTLVFYVSPHRVVEDLSALLEGLGDRPAALVRELTKLHEEARRGPLSELVDGVRAERVRGEVVVVVGGAPASHPEWSSEELARRARALMAEGVERGAALAAVARAAGVARRKVFDALIDDPGSEPAPPPAG